MVQPSSCVGGCESLQVCRPLFLALKFRAYGIPVLPWHAHCGVDGCERSSGKRPSSRVASVVCCCLGLAMGSNGMGDSHGWGAQHLVFLQAAGSQSICTLVVCHAFIFALAFTFWVFLLGGAEKVAVLQPVEITWYRTGLRGTTRGTVALTVGRVQLLRRLGRFGLRRGRASLSRWMCKYRNDRRLTRRALPR